MTSQRHHWWLLITFPPKSTFFDRIDFPSKVTNNTSLGSTSTFSSFRPARLVQLRYLFLTNGSSEHHLQNSICFKVFSVFNEIRMEKIIFIMCYQYLTYFACIYLACTKHRTVGQTCFCQTQTSKTLQWCKIWIED